MSVADLVPVELDLDVLVRLGHDLDQGEGRLAALLGVVGADPHEAVDAALDAQPAVGEAPGDLDRRALDPGLLALLGVDDVRPEAVALGPAEVHPQEHLRPVRGLGAAGAGADRQDRVLGVVVAGEQQERPLALELGAEARRPRARRRPRSPGRAIREQVQQLLEIAARFSSDRHRVISSRRPSASRRTFCAARWSSQKSGLDRAAVQDSATSVAPWRRGQRRPEVDRIRSARSRVDAASTSRAPGGPGAGSDGARSAAGLSCSGRRRGSRRGSSALWVQTPQLPSQSRARHSCRTGSPVRKR